MSTSQVKSSLSFLLDQKVLILGLGREGLSSYKFLRSVFPDLKIILADKKELEKLSPQVQAAIKNDHLVEFRLQDQSFKLTDYQVVIKSAGVSHYLPQVKLAKDQGVEFTSNTKLFFKVVNGFKTNSSFPNYPLVIGVTGTKGKTTTASLIYHLLKESGKSAYLGGNVGLAPLDLLSQEVLSSPTPIFVLELSSHQLFDLQVSPDIGVVQAISPEHLDYYPNLEEYYRAKNAIAQYQTASNWLIFNQDSDPATATAQLSSAQKIPYSLTQSQAVLTASDNGVKYQNQLVLKPDQIPIKGKHNLLNVMPAVAIGKLLELSDQQLGQVIKTFKPVEHRLEVVGQAHGVEFVNDSAGTTPESAIAALDAYDGKSIILIAGGSDKKENFDRLAAQIVKSKLKMLLLFPSTGKKIWQAVKLASQAKQASMPHHVFVRSMDRASEWAKAEMGQGDVVLLSPACASFTTFKNYQDRGLQFKDQVKLILDQNRG